jgi:hypothetical protein
MSLRKSYAKLVIWERAWIRERRHSSDSRSPANVRWRFARETASAVHVARRRCVNCRSRNDRRSSNHAVSDR